MKADFNNAPVHTWPKMAQVVNEAAAQLHKHYGEEGIPSDVLKREIERIGGYGKDSVIPSDYCYNVINKAPFSFRYLALVRVGRGRYKYVGPNCAYSGPVMWKPERENERQVGSWHNGECDLQQDPRQQPSFSRKYAWL